MSGTSLEIVLKVKDEATAILSRVGSQAISAFTRAAAAAKSAFSAAKSLATFLADSFKVLEKLGQGIGKVFEILKKYAPDSAEYLADVTRQQELVIQNLVESINRLKAAGENLLITVFSAFGNDLVATLDSISVWVAKNKDDIARFIVDVGKWLVDVFTKIGNFLGDMFRKIATAFGMDLRSSAEKELDSAIESMSDAMIPLLMRSNAVGLSIMSQKDKQDLAYMKAELERLRDLKKEIAAKNMLSDAPVLPTFTPAPTDKQMGVVRVVSEKESAAIEASKKSFEDLAARMNELRNSSVERTVEYYDKMLALQQGFIDIQAAKETEAGKALAAQIDRNLARREQATEASNEEAEAQAILDDIRLRKHLDDLSAVAKKMREEREKVTAELEAMVQSIAGTMSSSILNAFEAIVRGTMTVAQAFGTMVSSILIDVGRMLAQKQLENFLSGLVGSLVGGVSSGSGGAGPGSSNFAARSAPGAGLAWGGPVQSGTNYVVGERGAEFFRSSSSGSVSAPSMTINVNGARDPKATALEIRNEVVRLATVDGSFRRRLQTL